MAHCRITVHVLLFLAFVEQISAKSDVPAQFYKVSQASNLPPIEFLPSPMPDSIMKRIKGIDFSELSLPLKHALLWDVGLVASADTDKKVYVQIMVECGKTMADAFLPIETVEAPTPQGGNCSLVVCNSQNLHFAFSNCSLANLQPHVKCGILDSSNVNTPSNNPVWMEDGEIDSDPYFRVYKIVQPSASAIVGSSGNTTTTMFTIMQKKSQHFIDDRQSCPSAGQFIIPCRQLTSDDVQSAWCAPSGETFVDLWIAKELAQKNSKAKEDRDTTAITTFISLFVFAAVLCILFAACLWRRRRLNKGALSSQGGLSRLGGSSEMTDQQLLLTHNPMLTHDSDNMTSTTYPGNRVAAFTPAELEKVNANFCERSRDLAEFCDDQELMMKRISYTSLQFSTLIARGANGEVWRGEYASQDVAIKRMLRDKQGEVLYMEVFAREIRLASTLEHPNIVRFIGVSWRSLSELCMVSEFMPSGDLAHYLLSKESRNLSWQNHKMTLALDIANALVYLHSLMPVIIHRDLKSLNVLLNENLEAKLSDFGLSRERSFEETMTSGVGTLLWTAPEVLRGDRYSEKADIYSYGIVLSELDTCLPPYSLNEEVARAKQKSAQLLPLVRNGQIQPQFRDSVPKALHELALSCLDYVPEKRPNAMQIVYILRSKVMPTLM